MCLILWSTQTKKAQESSLSRGLALKSHVIFHVVYFFNTNEDVTNNN